MHLCTHQTEPPALRRLLDAVGQRLTADPTLATSRDPAGPLVLTVALPATQPPRMVRGATAAQLLISRDGWLYALEECATRVTGGWMCGSIPPPYLRQILHAWLAQHSARQLDLFVANSQPTPKKRRSLAP